MFMPSFEALCLKMSLSVLNGGGEGSEIKLLKWLEQFHSNYRKNPKFSDARNFAVIHLKFKQRGQT